MANDGATTAVGSEDAGPICPNMFTNIETGAIRLCGLGPFNTTDLTPAVVADVAIRKRIPMIVQQNIDGETLYGVVTHNPYGSGPNQGDGLKVICAGCWRTGLSLKDDRYCKTFSSYLRHWNGKKDADGIPVRNFKCCNPLMEVLATKSNGTDIQMDCHDGDGAGTDNDIRDLTDEQLLYEAKRRNLENNIVAEMDTHELAKLAEDRGIKPIIDARVSSLIHELRRLNGYISFDKYYYETKQPGEPHSSDKVGVDLKVEDDGVQTRSNKRAKIHTTSIDPVVMIGSP